MRLPFLLCIVLAYVFTETNVKALSHYDVWHQRMPTYEKFSQYVGVR